MHSDKATSYSPSVLIVGGGLAAMAAAISLRHKGFRVRILESRRKLGGRVGSFEDNSSEKSIDYCQHVGMACCTNLLWFLRTLEIEEHWDRETILHFFSSTGKHLPLEASWLPAPLHLSGLLSHWPGISIKDRVQIAWGLLKLMRLKTSRTLDDIPALEWLRSVGQTDHVIRRFWSTILVSALGDQIDRVTLGATRKVLIDGFAANREAYNLIIPRQPLSELIGDRAAKAMESMGIEIVYGTTVEQCQWKEHRCVSVVSRDGRAFKADHFVFAVPWHRLNRLIGDECDVQVLTQLQSAPITGVHTWWDRAWLDAPHAILVDRLCQWVFKEPLQKFKDNRLAETSLASNFVKKEHYYQIVISGSRDLTRGNAPQVLEMIASDLAEVFPKAADAKLLRGRVVTDPNSVFSVSPGHQRSRLPSDQFAQQNVWLAGDWTDTQWPATMEGAIRSGVNAANSMGKLILDQPNHVVDDLPKGRLARWLIA